MCILPVGLCSPVVVCGRFAGECSSQLPGAHPGEGQTVGDRYNPSLCQTGAGTSGVPAASFARRGLTARVCSTRTEGRESRRARWSRGGDRGRQRERVKQTWSSAKAKTFPEDRQGLAHRKQDKRREKEHRQKHDPDDLVHKTTLGRSISSPTRAVS